MSRSKHIQIAIGVAGFTAVCALAGYYSRLAGAQAGNWYSVVPPLLAIILAFLTRNVILSLGLAVIVGGFLVTVPAEPINIVAWLCGARVVGSALLGAATDRTNLQILAFVPPVFAMVETIIASGGFAGIVVWLLNRVRSKRSAQLATALMGVLCFIDDYANAMIIGSAMQPITDKFRVSRQKLAFIVDATSAPVSGLAVVSTWIAFEVSQFEQAAAPLGIDQSGYSMFFDALSFRFYCLLMLFFVFAHAFLARDFGPMRTAEAAAAAGGDRAEQNPIGGRGRSARETELKVRGRAINALVPLGGLLLFHLTVLWFDGRGCARLMAGGSPASWLYWREVISDAKHSHLILMSAATFGLVLAMLCGGLSGSLKARTAGACLWRGVKRAALPAVILVLAWSLQRCCMQLGTGQFLAGILAERIPAQLFAPILFVVASLTSFATGTSWGTMAILIPTAMRIASFLDWQSAQAAPAVGAEGHSYGLITIMSMAAVLDGAIFGDHCSPISDTTILSSTASSCDLVEHVRTQLPYSLAVAFVALLCAYVPSALGIKSAWCIGLAALVLVGLLLVVGRRSRAPSE